MVLDVPIFLRRQAREGRGALGLASSDVRCGIPGLLVHGGVGIWDREMSWAWANVRLCDRWRDGYPSGSHTWAVGCFRFV